MPSLVVLGAKYEQVPLMRRARNLGFRVIGVDYNEAPAGRPCCDHYYQTSYRDLAAVEDIVRRHRADGIATIGTNDAICTAARINALCGLDGLYDSPEAIERSTYKDQWRPLLKRSGVPIAPGKRCRSIEEMKKAASGIGFPLLVKPADASGSKGVTVVHDNSLLDAAFGSAQALSRQDMVIAERFIGHNSFAVEFYVVDGRMQLLAIGRRTLPPYPLCVGMGVTLPTGLPLEQEKQIEAIGRQAVATLMLSHGPVHLDMVLDMDGKPHVVDIGPRCVGGPFGWEHIPMVTGFHLVDAVLRQALGKRPANTPVPSSGPYFAHRYLEAQCSGRLTHVTFDRSHLDRGDILGVWLNVRPGVMVAPMRDSGQRYGYVTARGRTFEEVNDRIDTFLETLTFHVQPQT